MSNTNTKFQKVSKAIFDLISEIGTLKYRQKPRPCSHGYDIVPFHFGPLQKVVQRGVAFIRVRKKSSGPF